MNIRDVFSVLTAHEPMAIKLMRLQGASPYDIANAYERNSGWINTHTEGYLSAAAVASDAHQFRGAVLRAAIEGQTEHLLTTSPDGHERVARKLASFLDYNAPPLHHQTQLQRALIAVCQQSSIPEYISHFLITPLIVKATDPSVQQSAIKVMNDKIAHTDDLKLKQWLTSDLLFTTDRPEFVAPFVAALSANTERDDISNALGFIATKGQVLAQSSDTQNRALAQAADALLAKLPPHEVMDYVRHVFDHRPPLNAPVRDQLATSAAHSAMQLADPRLGRAHLMTLVTPAAPRSLREEVCRFVDTSLECEQDKPIFIKNILWATKIAIGLPCEKNMAPRFITACADLDAPMAPEKAHNPITAHNHLFKGAQELELGSEARELVCAALLQNAQHLPDKEQAFSYMAAACRLATAGADALAHEVVDFASNHKTSHPQLATQLAQHAQLEPTSPLGRAYTLHTQRPKSYKGETFYL